MTSAHLRQRSSWIEPVDVDGNVVVDWPRVALPMLLRGVRVDGTDVISRREVASTLAAVVRAWWAWTTALSGEVFWDIRRDLLVQVHQGVGRNRTVRVVGAEATHYPIVQRLGLDAVFALTPPERSTYTWRDLAPANLTTEAAA